MSTTETAAAPARAQWQGIDPATLGSGFYSEKVEIDPSADAFAIAPPLPDGRYIFQISPSTDPKKPAVEAVRYEARSYVNNQGETVSLPAKNVLKVNADLKVIRFFDESRDPSLLTGKTKDFSKGFATSTKNTASGLASEAVTLLQYLGFEVPNGTDAEIIAQTLYNKLLEKPLVGGELLWRAGFVKDDKNPKDFGKWSVTGMRNFPLAANGVLGVGPYSPVTQVNGQEYHAKAYLMRLFSLKA